MSFYAVRKGRNPGIFKTWDECQQQVKGFSGAQYKKFPNYQLAQDFILSVQNRPEKATQKRTHSSTSQSSSSGPAAKVARSASFDDCVSVYTDGCCENNGHKNPRAGIGVFWGHGNILNLSEKLEGRQTNNRAEIHAACRALEQAISLGHKRLRIYTDSNFMIESVTKWLPNWKRKGWKTSTGAEVKNKDDFVILEALCEQVEIDWVHVFGHSGIEGNEAADQLAKQGARNQLKSD